MKTLDIQDKFTELLPKFYKENINETNFEKIVFGTLAEIFSLKSACVYFINSDNLTMKYSYNCLNTENITFRQFDKLFLNDRTLVSELCIENYPYAKLVIVLKKQANILERKVFNASAAIVSNIIKDMEISSILKMQVEALRNGLDESNSSYRVIKQQNKKILDDDKIKNEFLANVSHQLRSPLNSIIGFADMLSANTAGKLNKTQTGYVKDIKIAGIKLMEMINEILDISKIETKAMKLFPKKFYLVQNIHEVFNILKPLYSEKNISIVSNIPDSFEITADYQKIQQVFFNLLSNAVKFTPPGGAITVSALKNKKSIDISIKDTGCGIAEENHKKIFKKFIQIGSQSSPSTGLGLTIANEIVKMHLGKVSVKSEIGCGAEFIVSLPKDQQKVYK